MSRRLPVFAELASPSTPAVTSGLVGCVTPIAIGPLQSPLGGSCRPSKRERILEGRVAMLKQRLGIALRENELMKGQLKGSSAKGSIPSSPCPRTPRTPLSSLRHEGRNTPLVAADVVATSLVTEDVVADLAPFTRELDDALLQVDDFLNDASTLGCVLEASRIAGGVRKRGGRGRGGKGKKQAADDAAL
ncbi:hypothetical protein T492DRAFT_1003770 [Pavlovales sp. CCMP2436]|nr:hypothetical protein T492DRAFT_1003770 [Pavlovales sp. CCMP2436]